MDHPTINFRDIDWSFADRVENAYYNANTITVIFKNGNRFRAIVPRELFLGIWQGGKEHILTQNAILHDDII